MSKEVERRIEEAFAKGESRIARCEGCVVSGPADTYRVDEGDTVAVYCPECAEEFDEYIVDGTKNMAMQ